MPKRKFQATKPKRKLVTAEVVRKKMREIEKRKPTKQKKKFAEDIKKHFGEQNIILTIKKGTDPVKVGELIDTLMELDIVVKIKGDIVITKNKPRKHKRRKK